MSKTFKIVLVLLVVASAVSASFAVFTFIAKEREYVRRLLLEDKLAATLKDKMRVEKELDAAKKEKEEIEKKILEIESSKNTLTSQIELVKQKSETISADLSAKEEEVERLKTDLENEKKEKLNISRKLEDLQFEYERAERNISKLENEKTMLEKKLADLKERSVNLDTIVVSPSAGSTSAEVSASTREPLMGRVLVVNREYSFVVTDLGEDDGVEKGMRFEVRDGTEFLGNAEIDKIYDTMSSATVLPSGKISSMKKGNLIIESR